MQVSRIDPAVKAIIAATFPDYRGRKISIRASERPLDVTSFWDGGSRSYFAAVDLRTLRGTTGIRTLAVPQNGTPFDGGPIAPKGVVIPEGFAIVEHVIFCGRDVGITIHVNPATMPKVLAVVA